MEKLVLTLVQRGSIFYPFKDSDYEILNKLGAPYETLDINSFPLLMGLLRATDQYDYRIMTFLSLEDRMKAQLEEMWGDSLLHFDHKAITIQASRSRLKLLNKVLAKLVAFYGRFDIALEVRSRTSKAKVTCRMTKSPKARHYVVPN